MQTAHRTRQCLAVRKARMMVKQAGQPVMMMGSKDILSISGSSGSEWSGEGVGVGKETTTAGLGPLPTFGFCLAGISLGRQRQTNNTGKEMSSNGCQ